MDRDRIEVGVDNDDFEEPPVSAGADDEQPVAVGKAPQRLGDGVTDILIGHSVLSGARSDLNGDNLPCR